MVKRHRPTARRGRKGQERRTALLDAACRAIGRKGLRGLRINEVAADAGVAESLIYHHFESRATLLRAALEHAGQQADTYTQVSEDLNGRDRLIATLLAEIQDQPEIRENSTAWGELINAAVFDEDLRPALFQFTQAWINRIAEIVRVGQLDGSIAKDLDPESVAQQLTALADGLGTRWLAGF